MMNASKASLPAIVAALGCLLVPAAPSVAGEGGPFSTFSGSWAGTGTIEMASGTNERIRCRASYTVPPIGTSLNQGLRCASDSYTFDVRSNVIATDGGMLTGTWSESTRQVSGQLSGRMTPGRIDTSVETFGFSAALSVATHGAHQSVVIEPHDSDVRSVRIEMRRT